MEVNPLNIFFVKSDSKGDRLLFRYPYTSENKDESKQKKCGRHNPYAVNCTEDLLQNPQSQTSNICKGQLSGFTDEMLSTLFAVKAELCNRKFELKVNDVRFVGHPTLLPYRTNKDDTAAMILINIVFALQASASHSIVKCYYDLSKRLGKALRHEEKRCSYLTEEMKIMLAAHDEVSALDSEINSGENDEDEENLRHSVSSTTYSAENCNEETPKSAFHLILQRSSLARSMKAVFEGLSSTGIVQVRINKWVLLSFCLPHKAHQIHNRGLIIEPETIDKCLQKLRPYHGMLLLVDPNYLLASIPLDGSPALLRLIKLYSPLKSLQTLAIEADLSFTQVSQLTGHLVYWAKATVIYPLCEGNVYVVAPGANIHTQSPLLDEFAKEFPGLCLLQMLSEFSLPAPLWYVARGVGGAGGGCGGGARLARVVAWLLRRRLLLQLHTYVQFNSPHWGRDPDGREHYCEKHDIYNPTCGVTFALNQMQLNAPGPVELRDSGNSFPDSDEDYPTENNLNQTDFSHTRPIVIGSEHARRDRLADADADSANHSYDGVDVVDGRDAVDGGKQPNSVDSGISPNVNARADLVDGRSELVNGRSELINGRSELVNGRSELVNGRSEHVAGADVERAPDSPSLSLGPPPRETDAVNKDASSDEDRFDADEATPWRRSGNKPANGAEKRNGVSLNLKLQSEMSFQPPTVCSAAGGCEAGAWRAGAAEGSPLHAFTAAERSALAALPAAGDADDLMLLARLHKKGYFRGEQHLEEIMFMENVTRSQLMQLLDKFKDVLITFETEDPAVAMLYPYQ
ncbi:unnamed protein product, partial [Iphiclides podalirius]